MDKKSKGFGKNVYPETTMSKFRPTIAQLSRLHMEAHKNLVDFCRNFHNISFVPDPTLGDHYLAIAEYLNSALDLAESSKIDIGNLGDARHCLTILRIYKSNNWQPLEGRTNQ